MCVDTHTCPEELGYFTVLFLATILSNFLAIRTSSSAGPMAGAPAEQGSVCGHSWALRTWGPGQQGEGAERRGKGEREGKRREGRESRKEVGLSRPVINSCQESEIARGRAKYSREPRLQERGRRAAVAAMGSPGTEPGMGLCHGHGLARDS